jgi:hypothetical protein
MSLTLITESFAQTPAQPAAVKAAETQPTPQPVTTTPAVAPVADPVTELPTADDEPVVPREPIKKGFLVNPNFTVASRKLDDDNGQPQGKVRTFQLDSKLGYVFDFGLYTGLQVNYGFGSSSIGTASDNDISTYYAGPSIGYSCNYTGLFLTATYIATGSYDTAGVGKYEKTTGYQIDLGYPMKVSENVQLGPQLSLKRIDLKDGTNALADTKIKELTPYFGLWLYF